VTEAPYAPPGSSPAPASGPALSPFAALVGTFVKPGETMARLVARPTWWLPCLIWIVVMSGTVFLVTPKLDMERSVRDRMEKQAEKTGRTLSNEEVQRALAMSQKFKTVSLAIGVTGLVLLFFLSGLLHWGGARAFGAEAGFSQVMALCSHASLVDVLKAVLSIPILLQVPDASLLQSQAEGIVKSSLAAFLGDGTPLPVRALAGSFDLFSIAGLILLVVGFRKLPGLSNASAAAVPILLWILGVMIRVGFSFLAS
jgi:hypothetical protein